VAGARGEVVKKCRLAEKMEWQQEGRVSAKREAVGEKN
jgi:hypothetical protein